MPEENIFLFVPNLIGYARIVFAIISFYFMPCCPFTASSFYLLSGLLDAFDGHAARALNQGDRTLPPPALTGVPTSSVLSLLSQNLVESCLGYKLALDD